MIKLCLQVLVAVHRVSFDVRMARALKIQSDVIADRTVVMGLMSKAVQVSLMSIKVA